MHLTVRLAVLPALLCALGLASAARAETLTFQGEHALRFAHNGVLKEVVATGTGLATVTPTAGGNALKTIRFTGPFASINATAMVGTATPSGIDEIHFDAVRINPALAGPNKAPGVFAPVFTAAMSGMLTRSTLAAAGTIRICNLSGCPASVPLQLAQTSAGVAIGPGVGGTFTAMGMSGTRVTVVGAPWTVKPVTANYRTGMGAVGTFMDTGYASGPLSMTGTTLASMGMGGKLQLVTATQTTCAGCSGSNTPSGQISRLSITFTPEPGLLVAFASGVVGLALIGRRRIRR